MSQDQHIKDILKTYRTIAVYGMSTNPEKPAHSVPVFLQSKGYTIIPINPGADEIAGCRCYPALADVEEKIDVLEVFRPSEQALDVVREAVERKRIKGDFDVIWLQLGIENERAGELAHREGFTYIENRCMKKEYQRMTGDRQESTPAD